MESAAIKGSHGPSFLFLLCSILFWVISPFLFFLLLSLFYWYRILAICLQKIVHPDWIGIMDPGDAVMSENDTERETATPSEGKNDETRKKRSNYLSVSIHVMSGSPNIEKIRQGFMEKIYLQKNSKGQFPYQKFSYYIKHWLGFRFWKKDVNFKVENHIKLIRLKTLSENEHENEESFGSSCYVKLPDNFPPESFKQLEKISEERLYKSLGDNRLTSDTSQMPTERSPWELLILPNYYPKLLDSNHEEKNKNENKAESGFFVLILRFEHTLFDGFSLKKMITVNLSGEKMESHVEKPKKSMFAYVNLQGLIHVPRKLVQFNWLDKDENVWHLPPEKLSENWHSVIVDPISFSTVKNVGRKLGVSTNTIIFGALDGGIQRMWKFQNKYDKLPKQIRVPFPWSFDGHPMDGLVNHWSYGEFRLPLKSVQSQKERFLNLEEQFQWQKKAKLPELFWHTACAFLGFLPHDFVDPIFVNGMTTLTVSNFPGPRDKLTFLGEWPLEDWTFCVPKLRSHAAIQMGIMSYRGWIRIVLTVNKALMSSYEEVQQFGQYIREEFIDLENMIK